MKKIISILMVAILMIAIVPLATFAASLDSYGVFTYAVTDEEVTITRCDISAFGDITIPSTIGDYAVTQIGPLAFQGCDKIKSVNIPDGVRRIDGWAFSNCKALTDITIPESVIGIAENAFYGCTVLKNVHISNTDAWCRISFGENSNPLEYAENFYLNGELVKEIVIPEDVTDIASYAFSCNSIESITIPASVKNIKEEAFSECDSLKNVFITDIAAWCNINFEGHAAYPLSYANNLYLNGEAVEDIVIPDSVAFIPRFAFSCRSIKSIIIPDSVVGISDNAFLGAANLEKVIIGNGVEVISDWAFSSCTKLNEVKIGEGVKTIGNWAFSNCVSLNNVSVPVGVKIIGDDAFANCIILKSINLPDTIISIGDGAFFHSDNLKDVWYTGSAQDKESISISVYNDVLNNAEWHFNTCKSEHYYGDDSICDFCGFGDINISEIFPDTQSNAWYSDAVAYVYSQGMMKGYSDGTFGVSDGIQRQDFLVMLARFDGVDLTQYGYDCNMPDVARDSYYEAAVNWGVEKGITTGYMNGKFGVGDMITREQIVTFLYRYAKYKNIDVENVTDTKAKAFPDYNTVTDFAEAPIIWAIDKGVINGKSGYIAPQGNAQRCEIAQIMYNIFLKDIF